MKKIASLIAYCLLPIAYCLLCAWGTWGHHHINKSAVLALPDTIGTFFYNHIDFITEESVSPDLRKYAIQDKAESPRHFFDMENYGKNMDSVPKLSKPAYAAYDEKFLSKNGSLPWVIQDIEDRLTKAFKDKNKSEILYLAANLGHYIADAHMPLHTTNNYDGQMTNQKGIHAFWESQLPELYGDKYNFYTGPPQYINDLSSETWRIIQNSHNLMEPMLEADKKLTERFPKENLYKKDSTGALIKNNFKQPIHTNEYASQYHEALKGMVESQMRGAISETANFWYTAWVNAGRPDLRDLDAKSLTKRNKKWYRKDVKAWKEGHITNLKADTEY